MDKASRRVVGEISTSSSSSFWLRRSFETLWRGGEVKVLVDVFPEVLFFSITQHKNAAKCTYPSVELASEAGNFLVRTHEMIHQRAEIFVIFSKEKDAIGQKPSRLVLPIINVGIFHVNQQKH